MPKKNLTRILLKFHVTNPYAIRISNFEFHQIRRRKIFWHRRVPPLNFQKIGKKLKILIFEDKNIKISENVNFYSPLRNLLRFFGLANQPASPAFARPSGRSGVKTGL